MIETKKSNDFRFLPENIVLRELDQLPDTYYIFHNVRLCLSRPVRYRNTDKYIRYCQIDFVVIGPTGIFIIEAKEWDERTLREAKHLPLKEADKAGLIFYIRIVNKFHRKFPIYNIAVMLTKVPIVQYGYVRHLSLKQLYWFILRREGDMSKKRITKIVRWINKITSRKAIIRRITN